MRPRHPATFLRDTIIVAVGVALLLAPTVFDLRPEFLRVPGYLLYFPLLGVYVILGGETEAPFGPTAVHVALYALALGVIAATVAAWIRTRFDVAPLAGLRFLGASALAVGGTIAAIFGVLGFAGLVSLATPGAAATIVVGLAAIAGSIYLVALER